MYLEHRFIGVKGAENKDRAFDNVEIRLIAVATENVNIQLPELTKSAALRTLVTVHIGN